MANEDVQKSRYKAHMEADYQPLAAGTQLTTEQQAVRALDYIAYQLGQINRKLDGLAPNAGPADKRP